MKMYRRIKATLIISLILVTISAVISVIACITSGLSVNLFAFGTVYAVLTYGFVVLSKEKKELDAEKAEA